MDFLVVDSDETSLAALVEMLRQRDEVEIGTAKSGKMARELLHQYDVRFVISQVRMPRMSGIELLRLIRRNLHFTDIPVLLITAHDSDEEARFAREELADGVLGRPFTADALLKAVDGIREARNKSDPLDETISRCRLLFLERKYGEAIDRAAGFIGQHDSEELLYILSQCHYRLANYDKALQYLKQLISRPSGKAMHLLSKVCMADGQCGDAIVHLVKANNQNPSNLDLKVDLGKLYLSLEMTEKAAEIFEGVLNARPSDLNLIKIGKAYLKKEMIEEAGRFLNEARDPIPETAYIFSQYGQALEAINDYHGALKQYEKSLKLVPKQVNILMNLGKMHLKLGKKNTAAKVFQYILKQEPTHPQARKILSYIQSK